MNGSGYKGKPRATVRVRPRPERHNQAEFVYVVRMSGELQRDDSSESERVIKPRCPVPEVSA